MVFQRISSVAAVALSYALVLLFRSSGFASEIIDSSTSGCFLRFVGDGDCDVQNNNEDCDYDGGDCCECTCVSTDDYECGENGRYFCVDPRASCVDGNDVSRSEFDRFCIPGYLKDGDCDRENNVEYCDYDGGDCCECTCVSTPEFTCGDDSNGGFACIDPSAPCSDDDDYTIDDDYLSASYSYQLSASFFDPLCWEERIGDGDCQDQNNREECGYDGGDCCECTCDYTIQYACDRFIYIYDKCIDPNAPCGYNYYADVGTKTTVDVSANAYATLPDHGYGGGCADDGCAPALTRNGITNDESGWRCAQELVPDGGFCELEFTFGSPQDILDIEVTSNVNGYQALEVSINGERVRGAFSTLYISSEPRSRLGLKASDVRTVTLTYEGTSLIDSIAIVEVRFLIEP